jgi:hypothetical protein
MTWTGQFGGSQRALALGDVAGVIQSVTANLMNNYNLTVEKVDQNIGILGSGSVTLYLRTNIDRGNGEDDDGLTDILANVRDAFTNANAAPQNGGVLNNYTPADQNGNAATGMVQTGTPLPTVKDQKVANPPGTDTGWFSGLGVWWDKTVGEIEAGSIGLVVGAVAVVGILVYFSVRSEV